MPADRLPPAFYERVDDDVFRPTIATQSAWGEDLQHGGPVSALAVWYADAVIPRPEARAARIAVDFLGQLPLREVRARARVLRPGRRIELVEAVLSDGERDVARAQIWRLSSREPGSIPLGPTPPPQPPPLTGPAPERHSQAVRDWGYGEALEWRFAAGKGIEAIGPSEVWTRMKIPLVAGAPMRGLDRLLVAADSANGVSAELDFREYLFVPPTISLALLREPVGEWTFMAASTALSGDGIGVTSAWFGDERGYLGSGNQALYVEKRPRMK